RAPGKPLRARRQGCGAGCPHPGGEERGRQGRGMTRIEEKLQELSKREGALICFLTAGDPSLSATEELILQVAESGADLIELGVPFSDPVADGPSIQASSVRALHNGTTLAGVLECVARV